MDLSAEEEEGFRIPLLGNYRSRQFENRIRCFVIVGAAIGFVGLFVICMLDDDGGGNNCHLIQPPELQLNSLLVFCPTIRDSVVWDLKFDLINTENHLNFCINRGFGYGVSVFLHNQSRLLVTAFASSLSPRVCIHPGNRTSLIGLVEDDSSSIQYLINEYGTIRLDLKLHNHEYVLMCGDVKVELSSSSSSSSCGSMVGEDPFACSYQSLPQPPGSQCKVLVCASPFLFLFVSLVLAVIIVFLVLFIVFKCCRR